MVPPLPSDSSDLMGDTDLTVNTIGQYPNPMDITGKFANGVPHLANLDLEVGNPNGYEHYPGASVYSFLWGMSNQTQTLQQEYTYAEYNSNNTLCFQGHQQMYDPESKKFDLTTVNTGHFGDRIYAGCGKVRRGHMKYLEPVSYTSQFGGVKTHITMTA
jgi:hypothetical protein